jgi:hypothetical protein
LGLGLGAINDQFAESSLHRRRQCTVSKPKQYFRRWCHRAYQHPKRSLYSKPPDGFLDYYQPSLKSSKTVFEGTGQIVQASIQIPQEPLFAILRGLREKT